DSRILAASCSGGRLSFFDLASGEELGSVQVSLEGEAYPLGYHRRHGWLVGVHETSASGSIRFWPCRAGPPAPSPAGGEGRSEREVLRIGPPRRLTDNPCPSSGSVAGRVLAVSRRHDGAALLHLDQPGPETFLGPQYDVRNV